MRTLLAISLAIFLWVSSAAAQTVAEACETIGKITVDVSGPPSRQRKRIVLAADDGWPE